jgi:type IV secretion system protein VirB2
MVHRGLTLSRRKGGLRYAAALAAIVFVQFPDLAFAGGSGLKWESATDVVVSSITGPIAYAAAVLALVGVAIAIIAGHGGMLMKAAGAVLGVSVLLFAPDFISTVWGGAAGAGLSGW